MTQPDLAYRGSITSRWHLVKLGELGVNESAFADGPFGSHLKTVHYRPTGARVVRLQNIGLGKFLNEDKAYVALDHYKKLERHRVEPGDIVVAALGDGARPAGRACVIPYDFGSGIVKADCFRVRLPKSIVHGEYLVLVMNSPPFLRQVADQMRGATRPRMTLGILRNCLIPLPSLEEQRRIAAILSEQLAIAERARAAASHQRDLLNATIIALVRDSLSRGSRTTVRLETCLAEVCKGIGSSWNLYPVLGATRDGLAPGKEGVGKQPERYKFVEGGTIFYNPMRILLGSIAMIDGEDAPGITSPDYVAFRCDPRVLHYRWFYYWLRSPFGERFIKGLTRGAVRERLLFNRLTAASIEVPGIEAQRAIADRMPLIRETIRRVDEQLKLTEGLPSAFLRRAFSGSM